MIKLAIINVIIKMFNQNIYGNRFLILFKLLQLGVLLSPQVQLVVLQDAYILLPIILLIKYISTNIKFITINPHNKVKKVVLKKGASFI